jgi:ATP-binding protein involved in chromosome partitioning
MSLPIKNIIAIASGKGGVGKSTTAVNLALALTLDGSRVGILDADIYGPNQPQMLGATERPEAPEAKDKKLQPIIRYGIQSMSIGYLVDADSAMIWRGPMVSTALQQLLNDTQWDNLDYLIMDLPPGTGDIQLTMAQKIPVSGAIIVTTPQDIALLDARKAIAMFRKVNVPVLGVVENMSVHVCSQCGHSEAIFGSGGGERLAQQYEVELLGSLPLDMRIREQADGGKPTVIAEPESKLSQTYRSIAQKATEKLAQIKKRASKFPKIVVENR